MAGIVCPICGKRIKRKLWYDHVEAHTHEEEAEKDDSPNQDH